LGRLAVGQMGCNAAECPKGGFESPADAHYVVLKWTWNRSVDRHHHPRARRAVHRPAAL
jgi:hypothetical protein